MSSNLRSSEYSGLNPNGSACSYVTLGSYNTGMPFGAMAPIPASQVLANTKIIIPSYGGMGYQSLTHGSTSSCGPYFNRTDAYPGMDAKGQCSATKYIARGCQ